MKKIYLFLLIILFISLYCVRVFSAPVVLKADPTISQKNVKVNSLVEVYFNEEMDEKSINKDSFKIVDERGKDIKGTIEYDKSQKKASFKPENKFKTGTVYLVVLGHSIKNKKGETIGKPYRWVFKTEGKSKNKAKKNKKKDKKGSKAKLFPPEVVLPKNKSTVSNKVKFEWKKNGDKYHIKIFKGKKLVLDKKLADNNYEMERDLPKGVYTWKIRVSKGKKWSGFSSKMYFIIGSTEHRE